MSRAYIVLLLGAMIVVCAAKCPPNSSLSECGTSCEPSCAIRDPSQTLMCKLLRTLQCRLFGRTACRCNENFFRNDKHVCVPVSQC